MVKKMSDDESQPTDNARPATVSPPDIIYLPDERQQIKKVTSGSQKRRRRHIERFATDDEEHRKLHEQMRARKLRLGAYVMQLAEIDAAKLSKRRRRGQLTIDVAALLQAIMAFNRVGTNMTQMSRALNELALIAREMSASRLEGQIEGIAESMRRIPPLFDEPVELILAALKKGGPGA